MAIGLSPILTTFVVLIVAQRFPRAGFRRSALATVSGKPVARNHWSGKDRAITYDRTDDQGMPAGRGNAIRRPLLLFKALHQLHGKTVANDLFSLNVEGTPPIFAKAHKRKGFGEMASKELLDDPGMI